MNSIFGKYVNNNSLLTKLDARFKLFAMVVLVVLCFIDFHIYPYLVLFGSVILIHLLGKLKFKPVLKLIKHMWVLMLIFLIINIFNVTGEVWFKIGSLVIYKEAIYETIYIFIRLVMILMLSNILTCSTSPQELTYALEFYLTPLKIFKLDISALSLMMSIALRFIPTLMEELVRIEKAQTSRGVDFKHGKYLDKIRALTSIIIPMFCSCFEKADDLSEAMVVKGYGMGKRSKYKRLHFALLDLVGVVMIGLLVGGLVVFNGVI